MPTESVCRHCAAPLDSILDLGELALSNFPPLGASIIPSHPRAPLDLCSCRLCHLVQLRHTVPPDTLFRQYWYRSGINESMVAELQDVARAALARVGRLSMLDVVLDVGANDGTLLKAFYPTDGLRMAYEPAFNLFTPLRSHCDVLVNDYFPAGLDNHKGLFGRVKILTSIACFYAVDTPHRFIEAVQALLHPEGVWIVQFQDLHAMEEATAFDNITFEHLFYPSLAAIERLLVPHGLIVIDAEARSINGGSLRLTIQHMGKPVNPSVAALRKAESNCEDWSVLSQFAWRVGQMKEQIVGTVESLLDQAGTIDLYAASTKSNTLLQYCGLGGDQIRQAWERTPEKIGRTTVTGIPIVSEDEGRADPPDVLLVGAWQFRSVFLKREADFLAAGGSMIFPLPQCEVVMTARMQ